MLHAPVDMNEKRQLHEIDNGIHKADITTASEIPSACITAHRTNSLAGSSDKANLFANHPNGCRVDVPRYAATL